MSVENESLRGGGDGFPTDIPPQSPVVPAVADTGHGQVLLRQGYGGQVVWFEFAVMAGNGWLVAMPKDTLTDAHGRTAERAWRACELKVLRMFGAWGRTCGRRGHRVVMERVVMRLVMSAQTWRERRREFAGLHSTQMRRAA